MRRLGMWLFGLAVAALAFRGLIALSRTDDVNDGVIGALTFTLLLAGVWVIAERETR